MDSLASKKYTPIIVRKKDADSRVRFGAAVRRLRGELGISQEKLAELAHIHRTYIGDVERGRRNISLINMVRVAKALRVPLSRLIAAMEDL